MPSPPSTIASLEVGRRDILAESGEGRQLGRRHREVVVLVERHHRHQAGRDELAAHLHARLERVGAAGVRDDQDVSFGGHGDPLVAETGG